MAVVIRVAAGESKDLGDVHLADDAEFAAAINPIKEKTAAAPPQPNVTGHVKLPDGRPAAGAHVAVIASRIQTSRGGDLSPLGEVLAEGTADDGGSFQLILTGVSSKTYRYASLIARLDGCAIAWQQLDLDAKSTQASLTLASEDPIRGRLVDIEGQPAAGVELSIRSISTSSEDGISVKQGVGYHGNNVPTAWLRAVTSDIEGQFTVSSVPAGHGVWLDVAGSDRFAPKAWR